jgi:hypothetical protein
MANILVVDDDPTARDLVGRVGMWRGEFKLPFPHPAHQTGRAVFPHPAFGQVIQVFAHGRLAVRLDSRSRPSC